jgi:hypothetical protein
MRKPVPGAVSTSDFSIRPRPGSPAISYRNVPLWDTLAASLDRYEFFLVERDYAWGDGKTTAATTSPPGVNGPPSPPLRPGSITQNPEPPPRFDERLSHRA